MGDNSFDRLVFRMMATVTRIKREEAFPRSKSIKL